MKLFNDVACSSEFLRARAELFQVDSKRIAIVTACNHRSTRMASRGKNDTPQRAQSSQVNEDLFSVFSANSVAKDLFQWAHGSSLIDHSIPYRSITHFSVEMASAFDVDAEINIFISDKTVPIDREFKRRTDIIGVLKALAQIILK